MKPNSEIATKVIQTLVPLYPIKESTNLGNPADTLIATLLSAQSTDVQVLKAFPRFRKRFPDWSSLAKAHIQEVESSIKTIGLFRAKAKSLKGLAQKIQSDFAGEVPKTMEELLRLPGVGRKTASVVLASCFRVPAIAVDTHVFRIAHRLGWSKGKTPELVEQDLLNLVPKSLWIDVNRSMVQFGREVCVSGFAPRCWKCPVAKWCPYTPKTKALVRKGLEKR